MRKDVRATVYRYTSGGRPRILELFIFVSGFAATFVIRERRWWPSDVAHVCHISIFLVRYYVIDPGFICSVGQEHWFLTVVLTAYACFGSEFDHAFWWRSFLGLFCRR